MWRRVEQELRPDGHVNLADLTVLRLVEELGSGARVTDVVSTLGITVGAASKAIDRLEAAGLAARSQNPDDRRSSLITLTEHGRSVHAQGVASIRKALRGVLDTSELDAASLTLALGTLLTRLSSPRMAGAGS